MIDAEYIARIKRDWGREGLREQYQNRLERSNLILNPLDPTQFHGMRADAARLLIAEAEALSQAFTQA